MQRPPTGTIPDAPGSYQFKDARGRVIYVGKARSLRQRVTNYFQDPRHLPPRTATMVASAETVEWIQVRNEVEALMLEYSLIKQHKPRFNIRLRDDKSYPFLAVTVEDEWPRPTVMRGRKRKGVRYFGPYGHAYAIRETLDLLLRTFPLRTCSDNKFRRHERLGRPCLLFHIEKCSGPCVGEVDREHYQRLTNDLIDFLEGDTDTVVRRLLAHSKRRACVGPRPERGAVQRLGQPVEDFVPQLGMGHLPSAEHHRHLHLVPVEQEAARVTDLGFEVVLVDVRPQLDLLAAQRDQAGPIQQVIQAVDHEIAVGEGGIERDGRRPRVLADEHHLGNPGVAGRTPQPVEERARAERPGQRMLAPARAEEKDVHGCLLPAGCGIGKPLDRFTAAP